MPVLQINNLSKRYRKVKALDNLNLTIEAGNIYGLLGPNGSGKTTTLGIILGILQQTSGDFEWFDGQYGDKYRMRIGAILETPNFYPYLNAIRNLAIVQDIKRSHDDDIEGILKTVDLGHRQDSKFRTYSLGMKQRLAIAATLIGNPDVVIFDEPTNGLDPEGIAEVRRILHRVADSGKTVIMASHLLDEVEKICTHVAIIKNGHLRKTGQVGRIFTTDKTLIIGSNDMLKLKSMLSSRTYIKDVGQVVDGVLECQMDESITAEQICQLAFDNNVLLNRLETRNRRLEEDFLELTKDELPSILKHG